MESSESDEDDYYPLNHTTSPGLGKRVPRFHPTTVSSEPSSRPPPFTRRSGNPSYRSSSESAPIFVDDILPTHPRKLRKNSCTCEVCGGDKLTQKMLFVAIPRKERQGKGTRMSSINSLSALIKSCRSGSFLMPILGSYRLSTIIKSVPNKVYVSPPDTPHLNRFLSLTNPSTPHKKAGGLRFAEMATASGYRSYRSNYLSKSIKPRSTVTRSTASTTHSDRKPGKATELSSCSSFKLSHKPKPIRIKTVYHSSRD